jgi:hypothetical protein
LVSIFDIKFPSNKKYYSGILYVKLIIPIGMRVIIRKTDRDEKREEKG